MTGQEITTIGGPPGVRRLFRNLRRAAAGTLLLAASSLAAITLAAAPQA